MARRKDHTRPELREFIRTEAEKMIKTKGFDHLTARALAAHIGYSAGTIYNVYPDMEALKVDINFHTLGRLYETCLAKIATSKPGFDRIHALADAYLDFAQHHPQLWSLVFLDSRQGVPNRLLPQHYQERLTEIFQLIEQMLFENNPLKTDDIPGTARLLWSCLHGITILTLDGRLKLVGAHDPKNMVDQLLKRYFGVL